jgi:two-component system, sensor histidine kinase and response regulator
MLKIYLILVFFCVAFLNGVIAQSSLKNNHSDTAKVTELMVKAESLFYENIDSSLVLFNQIVERVDEKQKSKLPPKVQNRYTFQKAYSLYCVGLILMNKNALNESKVKFEEAQILFEKINNTEWVGNCLNNIGYLYYSKGDFTTTLIYYKKAIKKYHEVDYYEGIVASYVNMAAIYSDQQEHLLAADNYRKALNISKNKKNENYISITSLNLALIYLNHADALCENTKNKTECSENYQNRSMSLFKQSYKINVKNGDKQTNAAVLNNIGLLYSKRKQFNQAFEYYTNAEKLAYELNNKRILAYVKLNIAEYYLQKNDFRKAQNYAEESIGFAKETAYPDVIKKSANVLKNVYAKQNRYKEALEMTNLYNLMKDSIDREVNTKKNIKKQLEITFEKKSFADSLKAVKEKAIVQMQLEKKESQQKYLILIIFISTVSAGLIFNRFRINRKQKVIIEQKNKELERLNGLNQKIFSVISHDFKGPISTLKGLLHRNEIISSENPLLHLYVKDIHAQLNQSDQMLESLLDWAKAELGTSFSNKDCVVLPVLQVVLSQVDNQIKSKNIKIEIQISEVEKINLPSDVLKIVLRNLLTNAIKFSFEDSKITILAEKNRLKVIDEGKGIDPKKLDLLLSKQVAPGLGTNQETGFGLGLYMCQELLLKNNAKLIIENNSNGKGITCVVITGEI